MPQNIIVNNVTFHVVKKVIGYGITHTETYKLNKLRMVTLIQKMP